MKKVLPLLIFLIASSCATGRNLYLTESGFWGLRKGATLEEFRRGWIERNRPLKGAMPAWTREEKHGDDIWTAFVFDIYDAPSVLKGEPVISHQEHVVFKNGRLAGWGAGALPPFTEFVPPTEGTITFAELSNASGTAWVASPGVVVTALHVVDRKRSISLVRSDGMRAVAKVVKEDRENDLALLTVDENRFLPSPLTLSDKDPILGEEVFTLGYPQPAIMGFSPKLLSGRVSSTNGLMNDPRTIQISVPIMRGNSGGPLFNMNGEVIGVTLARLSSIKYFNWSGDVPESIGFASKSGPLGRLLGAEYSSAKTNDKAMVRKQRRIEDMAERLADSILLVIAK